MTTEIPVDDTTKPWWDATRERLLLLQTCSTCGHQQHRPRSLCTACASMDLGWRDVFGTGIVVSSTVVHRSPDPNREPGYVVALIRLTEGPTMLTNLVGDDPASIPMDADVQLVWRPLPDGRHLPVFRRSDANVPAITTPPPTTFAAEEFPATDPLPAAIREFLDRQASDIPIQTSNP